MKSKLSLIVEAMDRANPDEEYFLNMENGKVFVLDDGGCFYIDDNQKVDDDILYTGDIIALPGRYEINEYKMINEFINTVKDEKIQNQLLIVIHGNGAFRRFKDTCINFGIINDWYKFRDNAYYELAKEWCLWNNIEYIDDVVIKI